MSGINNNKHFDCLKNTLPDNWTNSNATGYYNRAFWKRCQCEYGTKNICKDTADKWFPTATEPSKWTKGCSPCSDYYQHPANYYYSYNPKDCGDPCVPCDPCGSKKWKNPYDECHPHKPCGNCNRCRGLYSEGSFCCPQNPCGNCDKCHGGNDCGNCGNCNRCRNPCSPCNPCGHCDKCYQHRFCSPCNPCGQCDKCRSWSRKGSFKAYVSGSSCNDCMDVAIVYRMPNTETNCDNIVELKIPTGGSKEKYISKFSPEFIYNNRYQCATCPVYGTGLLNVIDNRREQEFTPSDQAALIKRGINNSLRAQQMIDSGDLINDKHSFQVPMNVIGRSSYYYLGNGVDYGSTQTGLMKEDITKSYFRGDI